MNYKTDDFELYKIDTTNGHEDYWFKTNRVSDLLLCHEYGEQGCEHIFEVVYSKDEDVLGIKRQFRFNWDVVLSTDENLKAILLNIIDKK